MRMLQRMRADRRYGLLDCLPGGTATFFSSSSSSCSLLCIIVFFR